MFGIGSFVEWSEASYASTQVCLNIQRRDLNSVYSVFDLSQNHDGDPTYKKINRLD